MRSQLQHDLNDEQRQVFETVRDDLDRLPEEAPGTAGNYEPPVHLVHCVTGSGKTEIYMHLIVHALAQGRRQP